jgi:uncharacterized protein YukE
MKRLLLSALAALALVGCDNPQRTVSRVQQEIAAYKQNPSDAAQEKIEADLATLDAQIKKLEAGGKTDEVRIYRASAENLRADYQTARMLRAMKDTQSAIKDIGNALREAGDSIGDAFRKEPAPTP